MDLETVAHLFLKLDLVHFFLKKKRQHFPQPPSFIPLGGSCLSLAYFDFPFFPSNQVKNENIKTTCKLTNIIEVAESIFLTINIISTDF